VLKFKGEELLLRFRQLREPDEGVKKLELGKRNLIIP